MIAPFTSSLAGTIISAVVAFSPLATFFHLLHKDTSKNAKRLQILNVANLQMTFWEGWLAVRTKALTGEALEEALRQASEAMEVARKVADHNLQALRGASSVPRPQNVPGWRWALLLYLPEKSKWLSGYYYRAIFLACILCLLWILKQCIVIANHVQLRDAGLFLSSMLTKGLIQLLAMEMGVLLIGAMLMQHIAHSESISLRPIEIEKI